MKSLIIILTFLGIIGIAVGYVNQIKKCPPSKVEYRYIPRTFEQDQENPVKVIEMYNSMFMQPTPWVRGINFKPTRKEVDRYFVSQA